ncbi:MAG: arginine decarboxylase [Zetaproteobacteria bacterium CG12_big_fil_rev_8_21_14_0_65_55_1124]|nr:MAG: arginine decarboxylase [Zetaproteobacteria bacterium CG08_land_8_20_14_0_20_55_17]PIW42932.1 MAG: arginine decarboxylase [Zetaproteobacteria bacterium CG12_big_fil_rev_8_21_14_0_65_55_1124]PIY51844.1 MAG: arginine decarboxylase [Zetaproteobacteria bacterium CG_4_10_14_0_8_um_filter_55_43]PIZ39904.1 MAG: arginine decarboxylase [Zetaproteobacteria bacterium CG_4_10_14_0_2_um_filter_55_20]PJB79811.1 MAG: arginine decarboxylase [Zetaproteobacteria bacterium CG_4_9_14_0_8_um_filter_55_31]
MMAEWKVEDAAELYQVQGWGSSFFGVNEEGHMVAIPDGKHPVDLKKLYDELTTRDLYAPLLLRFSDILRERMAQIHERFTIARDEAEYQGQYFGVYPIKVNQQRQVVEEIVEFGSAFNWGLEAGSKPELHATLAMLEDVEGLIVCNGYKDREFIELAMIGRKMGKRVFIVVEKPNELDLILEAAKRFEVEPLIGLRCRLAATSKGLWEDSGGDNSKFGLSASDLVEVIDKLKSVNMLDCLRLLHFHIGSQVPQIRRIKQAMQEAARFYVEMRKLGAPIEFMDVGGGLGVNYDGSVSANISSVDYSLQEYANDIVWTMKMVCDDEGMPHPNIISESGRALVAHHAVLLIDVLGVSQRSSGLPLAEPSADAPMPLYQLWETLQDLPEVNPRETLHDVVSHREDVNKLFALGHCSLADRAHADALYWHMLGILIGKLDEEELDQQIPGIRTQMADRYFCNFSLFQSLPDSWAIDQVFPVVPIHRLNEEPSRQAILVDITCDSDGKIQQFPLAGHVAQTLPLHPVKTGEEYIIGIFLTGAYQEILGDLHNLFGDTHAVHVRMDGDHYELEQVVEGESVAEVLDYVQFHETVLLDRMRRQLAHARKEDRITAKESTAFLNYYREGLKGYTYLEENAPMGLLKE